jgi:3-methyladenine DNA glycosylase AlkD
MATFAYIKRGEFDDTLEIARLLLHDSHDLIHKAVGGWVREAGKQDRKKLFAFLDRHAATMPRVTLRFAIEHLDAAQREHYLGLKKAG